MKRRGFRVRIPATRPPSRSAWAVAALAALGSAALATGLPRRASAEPPVAYVGPEDVASALRALEGPRARLSAYGRSAGGRELLVLRIGRADGPQILVHGGVGARDAAGTAAALDFARRVLEPAQAGVLDRVGFLVAPAPNPDALATFFASPSRPRLGGPDLDRDHDGRLGEDGPDDLDGDGEVLWMRRPDLAGTFGPDDAPEKDGKRMGDPRLVREAGADARRGASWHRTSEGKDDDGDGAVDEDPPGTDLLLHFPGVWEDVGPWPGDGPFPGYAPEVSALLDLSHDAVALVAWYAFASEGPRFERASERGEAADADAVLYDALAGAWKGASGGVETRKASERGTNNAASELDWASKHLGCVAVRVPVWRIAKEEGNGRERADPDELDWLLWDDARGGRGFVPWRPFAHPTLGPVEVGGWKRFTRFEPPKDLLGDAVRRVSLVPAVHADFVPRLEASVDTKALGAGLFEVTARAHNRGGAPTDTKVAEAARRHMPVRMSFAPAQGVAVEAAPGTRTVGVLAAGGSSGPQKWVVRRQGAGDLGVVEVRHRAGGTARAAARTP